MVFTSRGAGHTSGQRRACGGAQPRPQAARGEFVAFTDDDCRPHPTWLEGLVESARRRPAALVGGTTLNGLPDEVYASVSQLIVDLVYEHFNVDRENAYVLSSNNTLCARERFLDLGGFDESFPRAGAEDRDFCDRWRTKGWPIVWHPEAVVEHRHSQTLRKLVKLHFRYGRGAYRYQAIRRSRRSGTMREDVAFHRSIPRWLWQRLGSGKPAGGVVAMLAAMIMWQAVNAAGLCVEAASRTEHAGSRGPCEGAVARLGFVRHGAAGRLDGLPNRCGETHRGVPYIR